MTFTRLRFLSLTLIALGLAISGYLLLRYLWLAGAGDGTDVCSMLFGTGCDAALRSPVSVQLGLPLAGWGVVYYTTLAAFLLLAWSLGEAFQFEATLAALILTLVACLGSVALAVMMLAGQSPFCPLCAVVHVINLVLVVPLRRMTDRPIPQLMQALAQGAKYLVTGKTADPTQARWKLLGFFAVALVAVVMYQWVLIEARPQKGSVDAAFDPQQALAAFEARAEQNIPIDANDPALGPSGAPVQLVLFSDFQCPACTDFSHEMEHLVEQFEGNFQIVFKHFPLGTACNPSMEYDLHPRACEAARAAEAARRQGKFWAYHDALFATDLGNEDTTFTVIAKKLGLDLQRFEADRMAESSMAKVKSDIELANRLGVDATPTIFLNSRYVSDHRSRALQLLIKHELQHAKQ